MNKLDSAKEKMQRGFCHFNLERDGKYCSVGALASAMGIEAPSSYIGNQDFRPVAEDYEEKAYKTVGTSKEGRILAETIIEQSDNYDSYVAQVQMNSPEFVCEVIYDFNDYNELPEIEKMFEKASAKYDERL